MVELKLSIAGILLRICCYTHFAFATDDRWVTQLQQRMDILEKQDVRQSAINLRQQQTLEDQARQLKHTKDLVINLQEFIAAQTLELEKQRNEIENLNEHMHTLSTQVTERDAEIKVLTVDIAALKAEFDKGNVSQVELSESAATKRTYDDAPSAPEAGKMSNNDTTVPRSTKTTTAQVKTSRVIKHQSRFVLNREGPFAFHAVSDKPEIPHLQKDQSILFETVLLNIGGAYHSNHSLFIAEMPGVYLFSVSILTYVNAHSEYTASLVRNGGNLALIYGHGDAGRHDQGSVTVITQLKAGDEVWVKLLSSADDSIYGGRYTTFSGVMLYQM